MSDSQSGYQPTQATDVVGVFDNNFNQLFADARPIKASVKEKAKLMKHPVETGATVSDFRIIENIKIDLHIVCMPKTYIDTYNQIKQIFLGNTTIQVQTNTGLYSNMMIEGLPHEEAAEHFDTIKLTLSLEQVIIASSSISALPASATTKKGGNVSGSKASDAESKNATEKTQKSSAA